MSKSKCKFMKTVRSKSQGMTSLHMPSIKNLEPQLKPIAIQLHRYYLPNFQYIGIYYDKVIITYNNNLKSFGYFDQHAVHERIRYYYYLEQFKLETKSRSELSVLRPWNNTGIEKSKKMPKQVLGIRHSCMLKVPYTLTLSSEKQYLWGICYQKSQIDQSYYITSHRYLLHHQLTPVELLTISHEVSLNANTIPKVIDQWLAEISCKCAIKFNDRLTKEECQILIYNLSLCDFPWHCVHGRATVHLRSFL